MDDRNARQRSLLLALLAFLVVLIIWQIPDLNSLLYPFRLFVTTVHELGHGLAAVVSGGEFIFYEVTANGSGQAWTRGGADWLIVSAGYLGTAVFGAALLYLTNRTRRTDILAALLGLAFAILTVLYARSLTAILAGGLTAAALVLIGAKAAPSIRAFTLNFLAIITGLNAVLDLWGLLNGLNSNTLVTLGGVPNDAFHMAQIAVLPPLAWALIWTIVAVGLLGAAVYYTFWRPFRERITA